MQIALSWLGSCADSNTLCQFHMNFVIKWLGCSCRSGDSASLVERIQSTVLLFHNTCYYSGVDRLRPLPEAQLLVAAF